MGFFDDRERGDLGPPPDPFRIGGGGDDDGGLPRLSFPIPVRWLAIAAGFIVVFIILNVAKGIWVDVLWFDSVGRDGDSSYSGVFKTILLTKIALFGAGALIAGSFLGLNIWLARRFTPEGPEESFIEEVDPQAIRRIVGVLLIAGTLFLAVIFGSTAGASWETILSWLNAVEFGRNDPQFGRDISFYIFSLPAFQFIQGWFLALLIISTLGAGAVYALTFSLQRFELNITRGMRIHLSILLGMVLLLIAGGTYLSIFNLVSSPGGIVYGATFTDVNARLPVRWALVALAAFAGLATVANAFLSSGYRVPIFFFGLWAVAGIAGGLIYPSIVQSVNVDPNLREKERPFIQRNITATRFAYGIDGIVETPFPAEESVSRQEILDNSATIDNIRLHDARPLRDTFNEIQAIRQFYLFTDVDVDRYEIDGKLQQVMISARELEPQRALDTNWTRERLQLTHGFGAVITPVNKIEPEGLPTLLTKDIPPVGDDIPITIEGARIYFGEITAQYVIVNSAEAEFDYPLGEGFSETNYLEDRGIRLGGLLRRLALSWELGDTNLLISGQIGSGSRLLMNRNIDQRIEKIAPFLLLDADPYLVVEEGELMWIQDAYTTASRFPYSQPRGGINYIRNSVKITVDAQTGDTTFYLIDTDDPIAATWAKIFPGLFTSIDELSPSLRTHLRYPETLFRLQADIYLEYHITDPDVFFLSEDFWSIPTERFRSQEQEVEPYYVIMRLPGEEREEFALILPFTPRDKRNTVAWLAGRSDGEFLGTLRAYRFPTDTLVFGPAQIEARIDQDPGISQQLSLWEGGGSEVIRGNLLMIPIGDSFLFVEPIYLQAATSRLPELQRIVVANGNRIAMERTFEQALAVVLGLRPSSLPGAGDILAPPVTTQPEPTPTPRPAVEAPAGSFADLIGQARDAADDAQGELDRLRDILDALERTQDE